MNDASKQSDPVHIGGLDACECPRWRDGELWFTDGNALKVLNRAGDVVVHCRFNTPLVLGLAFEPSGSALVGDAFGRRIYRVRLDGEATLICDLSGETEFPTNEIIALPDGSFVVEDMGYDIIRDKPPAAARLMHVASDGTITRVGAPMIFANGTAMLPDGRGVLIVESGAGKIWEYSFTDAGQLGDARLYIELSPAAGVALDGISLAGDGSIWGADIHAGAVVHIGRDGTILERRETGFKHAMSCALTPDERTLYATCTNQLPSAGAKLSGAAGIAIISLAEA